jgi:hypothetical protein
MGLCSNNNGAEKENKSESRGTRTFLCRAPRNSPSIQKRLPPHKHAIGKPLLGPYGSAL